MSQTEATARWLHGTKGRFVVDPMTGQLRYGPGAPLTPYNTVYLARHGQTRINRLNDAEGWANSGLNDSFNQLTTVGRSQARTLASVLFDQLMADFPGLAAISVVTSALQRAQDTAVPFLELLDQRRLNAKVTIDPDINEIDLGTWNNRLFSDLPDERERMKRFRFGADARIRPPNGEGFLDLLARTEAALVRLRTGNREPTVWFTHSTTISAIRMHAKEAMFQDADGILRWTGNGIGGGQCVYFNDRANKFAHLQHEPSLV